MDCNCSLPSQAFSRHPLPPPLTPPLQRKNQQKARNALLSKPYSELTWQEKLQIEDIRRKHAARLHQKADGPKPAQAKPPTPYNTTEVRLGRFIVACAPLP